jgi:putative endonuclease
LPRRGSGFAAEQRAAWWYRLRGWTILGENVWAGGNELDLIVRRGRALRFVEVKAKRGSRFDVIAVRDGRVQRVPQAF